jgi:hypothetical protein
LVRNGFFIHISPVRVSCKNRSSTPATTKGPVSNGSPALLTQRIPFWSPTYIDMAR